MKTLDESLVTTLREAAAAVPPDSTWRHRSGGLYVVTCVALEEATLTPVVVYAAAWTGPRWTRPVGEFLDGRFVPEFIGVRLVPEYIGVRLVPEDQRPEGDLP